MNQAAPMARRELFPVNFKNPYPGFEDTVEISSLVENKLTSPILASHPELESPRTSVQQMRVRFQNKTKQRVDLFWVGFNKRGTKYGSPLKPNEYLDITTYENHIWCAIRSSDGLPLLIDQKEYYVQNSDRRNVIRRHVATITEPILSLSELCCRHFGAHGRTQKWKPTDLPPVVFARMQNMVLDSAAYQVYRVRCPRSESANRRQEVQVARVVIQSVVLGP